MQFVDKSLPKKCALGSNPPELLRLWQKSQRPQKCSIIMFASQPWNEHEMGHWDWFLHYPVAFWFLKEIKIPIFPEERERRFTDFITNLKQIEQKIRGVFFFFFFHTQQGLLLKPANICALKYLLLGSKEVSFWNMCDFIDLPHFQKLNKKWRHHPLLFLKSGKNDTSAKQVWMGHSDLIINRCRRRPWAGTGPDTGSSAFKYSSHWARGGYFNFNFN